MAWSDDAWKAIADVYQKILDGPFVSELAKGTLCEKRFLEYMVQDKLYLDDFNRAFSIIAARAPTAEDSAIWAEFCMGCYTAETKLHHYYIENHELTDEMKKEVKHNLKNPTNELYTSFTLKHAALSPFPVAVAAALPCIWIYNEVGHHHIKSLKENPDNKYARWIELYGADKLKNQIEYTKNFVNKLAENAEPEVVEAMHRAFYISSVCELKFWQAAYDNEQWL